MKFGILGVGWENEGDRPKSILEALTHLLQGASNLAALCCKKQMVFQTSVALEALVVLVEG